VQNLRLYLLEQTSNLTPLIESKKAELAQTEDENQRKKIEKELKILVQVNGLTEYAREKYQNDDPETLESVIVDYFEGKNQEIMSREISPLTMQIVLAAIKLVDLHTIGKTIYNQMMENLQKLLTKIETDKEKSESDLENNSSSKTTEETHNKGLKIAYQKAKSECEALPSKKKYREENEARALQSIDKKALNDLKESWSGCEASYRNFREVAEDGRLCSEKYIETDPTGYVLCLSAPKLCE
jgi:hypothetical protein